jgi:hypothetical protein
MQKTSPNSINEQNNKIEKLLSIVNNKIACKTHPTQEAKSICKDCKTFCCLVDNCGQPHIYHQMENLERLIKAEIFPFLSNLKEVNENLSQNKIKYTSQLYSFKNNLKNFSVEAKKKIDEEYRKILNSLQTIYNSQMEEINEFFENLDGKFENISGKITNAYSGGKDANINEINDYLNNILDQSKDNESFLSLISKDSKQLNAKLKDIYSGISKFDFNKEITEVKTQAEKDYPQIDRSEYFQKLANSFDAEAKNFLQSQQKKQDKKSLSKMKKMVSIRQTMIMQDNFNSDLDLDIFVRYLVQEVNKIRQHPSEAVKFLDEYLEILNNEESALNHISQTNLNETVNINASNKISFVYDYLSNLIERKANFPALEWDNDLSNSAEDYLKINSGKIDKDQTSLLKNMKEIIQNSYYTEYQNVASCSYIGTPELNKVILSLLLNEVCWNSHTKQNILFDLGFNLCGFCACVSPGYNKIGLVMNFSLLKK